MKPATVAASILLTVVALLQLLRAVAGVRVMVGDTVIPIWVSVVAFVVAGGVAIGLWRGARRNGEAPGHPSRGAHSSCCANSPTPGLPMAAIQCQPRSGR